MLQWLQCYGPNNRSYGVAQVDKYWMKLFLWLSVLLPAAALAQLPPLTLVQKPVACGDFGQLLTAVINEPWNETLWWRGKPEQQQTTIVLLVNTAQTNWTLLEYKDNQACVLGSGAASELQRFQNTAQ